MSGKLAATSTSWCAPRNRCARLPHSVPWYPGGRFCYHPFAMIYSTSLFATAVVAFLTDSISASARSGGGCHSM